jgi:hypothetical protein
MDSGNTNGIIRGMENSKNLIINDISKSLPASSAINARQSEV